MVIVGRPMNSNDPQRCPFDKFLIGLCYTQTSLVLFDLSKRYNCIGVYVEIPCGLNIQQEI